jgi:hypothetical protein
LADVDCPHLKLAPDYRHDLNAEQIRCGNLLAMQALSEADTVRPPIRNRRRND